ncbi:MAG: hypothetical protein ABFS56_19035, partial [Pseudomonadota bacterium]
VSRGYQQRLKEQRHLNPGELEGDLEFLMRAVIKVDNIREDLGRVGSVTYLVPDKLVSSTTA